MKVDSGKSEIVIKGNEQSNELVDEIINERRLMMLKGIDIFCGGFLQMWFMLCIGIRAWNSEYKQYDVISEQFDSAFIGKNIKKKELERMRKKEEKQENNEFRRRQRILAKCKFWFHNDKIFESKLVISHSENIYLGVPTDIGTIHKYHLIISPKDHYSGINQLDEDVAQEVRNFKKSLVALFAEK